MKNIPILENDEIIKDIPGYEGLYAVTSSGRVWSYPKSWDTCGGVKSHDGKWLSPSTSKYGALVTKLSTNYFSIAKLVALTYIPNPDNFKIVGHIDKNQLNNHISNLKWTTKSAQIRDDIYNHNKTHGQCPKKVQASTGETFNSMREAAIWCGLTTHTVIMRYLNNNLVRGKYQYKSAGKHPVTKEVLTWKYIA